MDFRGGCYKLKYCKKRRKKKNNKVPVVSREQAFVCALDRYFACPIMWPRLTLQPLGSRYVNNARHDYY